MNYQNDKIPQLYKIKYRYYFYNLLSVYGENFLVKF